MTALRDKYGTFEGKKAMWLDMETRSRVSGGGRQGQAMLPHGHGMAW